MKAGPASRRQHVRFCELEGWDKVRNARGKPVRHHITYELTLPNGRVLRTRVSRPANAERYGPALWSTILNAQLCVTEAEFWDCVGNHVIPEREAAPARIPAGAIPATLAYQLIHTVGLTDTEVAGLTRDEAVARMNAFWSAP